MKPEQTYIAITRNDGGLSIMVFVTKSFLPTGVTEFEREANDENINAEIAKSQVDVASWRLMTKQETEAYLHPDVDRTFRNAWKDDGNITVDMPKAREIHREKLRQDRAPLMAALDVEAIRADEENDKAKKAGVVARKQALRDITTHPGIEAAETPEELKAITI